MSELSQTTLELCDTLIDGVTISSQHPELERVAKEVALARREITAALVEAGGTPVAQQRP